LNIKPRFFCSQDSKDQDLNFENTTFEVSLDLEKVPHEKCEQNFPKNEAKDNTMVNGKLNNINNSMNWSSKKKGLVLAIIVISGITSPIVATIHFPVLVVLQNEFNVSNFAIDAFASLSTFFIGIGPIVFAAYSDELATRKKVFIATFLMFTLSSVVCAIATTFWLLIVMRSIQAIGISAVLPLGSGVISDIYSPLASIVGGYITQYLGWRWIFWILAIFGGSFGMAITFNTLSTYLVDSCPGRGASVTALACLVRLSIPGIITIFETSIEEKLGVRWMFTLIS
ncbi:11281_t:CDS:2, partial [Gigaspora margarita]